MHPVLVLPWLWMKNDFKSCSLPATRIDYHVAFGIFFVLSFKEEEGLFINPFFLIFQVKACCLDYLCCMHTTVVKKEWQIGYTVQFCSKPDTALFAHLSPSILFRGICIRLTICIPWLLKNKLIFWSLPINYMVKQDSIN